MTFSMATAKTALARWAAAGTGLPNGAMVFSGQGGALPKDDNGVVYPAWISLKVIADVGIGTESQSLTRNPLVLPDDVVEAVDADADALTLTAHAYVTGDGPVTIASDDTLPSGLADDVDYFVVVVDDDTIKLAVSRAAAVAAVPVVVDIVNDGVGTHTISVTADTTRPLEEIRHTLSGHRVMTLSVQCFATDPFEDESALAYLRKLRTSIRLPSQQELLRAAGMAVSTFGDANEVGGSTSAASSLTPRAVATVRIAYVDSATEVGPSIESADVDLDVSV